MFKFKGFKGRARAGFSLIDVIVLMSILVVIEGLVIAGVQKVRDAHARTCECGGTLRGMATAVNLAHDQNKTLPPFFGAYCGKGPNTFHYHLLPYVENMALWNAPDPNAIIEAFLSTHDATMKTHGAGGANFVVNLRLFYSGGGLGELQTGDKPLYLKWGQVQDGTSNTLLFATKYHVCGKGGSLWLDPGNNAPDSPTAATFGASMGLWQNAPTKEACNPLAGTAVSFKPDAITVVCCDASVHTISPLISPATWQALHTPNGQDFVNRNEID